jgi:hypothetical protein
MQVWPSDLQTLTGAETGLIPDIGGVAGIRVTTDLGDDVFERLDVPMFQRALSVVTWPERTDVAGHVVWHAGVDQVFGFVPDSPLGDRWYAVVVDVTETSTRYSTQAPQAEPSHDGNTILARFFPGSRPRALVSLVDAGGSAQLQVGASEPLILADETTIQSLVTVDAGGTSVSCEAASDPWGDLRGQGYTRLTCAISDLDQTIRVVIHPGLVSTTGVPLADGTGATGDLVFEWNPVRDGTEAPDTTDASLTAFSDGGVP